MSEFAVTLEKVGKVWQHPNADKLDLATIDGMDFQFVVGKGSMEPGQWIIYFPIDSVLPENILNILPETISKKLHGAKHCRVKTARLRGEISQGLALDIRSFPLSEFEFEPSEEMIWFGSGKSYPKDLTKALGVTKYEPPEPGFSEKGVTRRTLPALAPHYDIESCDRNLKFVELLMHDHVIVTEKLEGSNCAVVCENGHITVCSRNHALEIEDGICNPYYETAFREGLFEKAKLIENYYKVPVTVRAELVGPAIQGNIYKKTERSLYVFEIWLSGRPINYPIQEALTKKFELRTVPTIWDGVLRDWLCEKTVKQASNGPSLVNPDIKREGIVIRPLIETTLPRLGRLILKQRSPEYLGESDL